eukprot:8362150-Pyramimonas_sp.AAC.1
MDARGREGGMASEGWRNGGREGEEEWMGGGVRAGEMAGAPRATTTGAMRGGRHARRTAAAQADLGGTVVRAIGSARGEGRDGASQAGP